MKLNLKLTTLVVLLAVLAPGLPVRADDASDALEAKTQAAAKLAEAQAELEKTQAKLDALNEKEAAAGDKAFSHRGGSDEPTVQIGRSIHIKAGESVQDLVVVFGDALVDGTVNGNLVVVFGEARVNGKVEGEAINVGQGLILGAHAVIGDNAIGVLGGVEQAEGSKVGGHVESIGHGGVDFPQWMAVTVTECVLKARPLSFSVGWVWLSAVVFLLGYLLLYALFPRPVASTAKALEERGATSFLMGLLALPLFAFVALILITTVVGIVVVPFLLAALVFAVLFGKVGLLRHLGGALLRLGSADTSPVRAILVGFVLLSLLYVIPFLGLVAWAVLTMWGLGAALITFFGSFRKERAPALAAPAATWTPPATPAPAPAPSTSMSTAPAPAAAAAAMAAAPSVLYAATSPTATTPEVPPAAQPGFTATPPITPQTPQVPYVPVSAPAPLGAPEAFSLPRVGLLRRIYAGALDWLLLLVVLHVVLWWLPERGPLRELLCLAYFIGFYVWKGSTLGGLVLGLKVVRLDGRKVDFACALVRALAAVFSGIAGGLGFFWCAWDKEQQTWHDKLAGTVVVQVAKSQSLV